MKKIFALLLTLALASSFALAFSASAADLPAVVDKGDIFTGTEEAELSERAAEIIEKYGYDVLILTDINKTGLSNPAYSEDYYVNNGYGRGDDRSGVYFYYNNDPDDRRWWYDGAGRCEALLTDAAVDAIDSAVQPYFDEGDKFGAVDTFLDRLDKLFSGEPLSVTSPSSDDKPYWYPETVQNPFPDFHGVNLPRVVDDADIFTDAEEAELTRLIEKFIADHEYKYDLVLYTDTSNYGLRDGVLAADFYQFNGYGKGDNYSGSVIFISMEKGNRYWWSAARGDSYSYFNMDNVNAIDDRIEPYMIDGDYFGAMKKYIDTLYVLYEKGSVPNELTASDYVFTTVFAAIPALIVGLINRSSKMKSMKNVAYATNANDYVVPNSVVLRDKKATFLYQNVVKTYIPPSSSSSGGGRSSGGGYHSSGGGSFSGGGRHF